MTVPEDGDAGRARAPWATVLLIGVAVGLTGGLLEVAVLTAQKLTGSPIMELTPDYLWMAPTAQLALVLVPAGALAVVARIRPSTPVVAPAVFLCAAVALLNLFIFVPRVHQAALLVLAAGAAFQLARWSRGREAALHGAAARAALAAACLVILLGAGSRGWRAWSEGRAAAALPAAGDGVPNVLLITLDTVRGASMSLYGFHRATTPRLEEFAREGVVFDRAIATAPWTLPTHASLFTGRWAHEMDADYRTPLGDRYPTLAEHLAARGYLTAGFVANLMYCGYETGLDRGFVHYDDYGVSVGQILVSSNLTRSVVENFRIRRLLEDDTPAVRKTATELNDEFLAWLEDAGDRPFFAFLNYFDAHEPYLPPAPFDTMFGPGRARGDYSPLHHWLYDPAVPRSEPLGPEQVREERQAYQGAIAYLDSELGRLFDALRRRGTLDETLVVVTSDHGEEFGRHGVFEHGYSLYRPSVHVPLLVRFPGRVPAGRRVAAPVSLRRVPATVVDLLGHGDGPGFPGPSLAGHWDPGAGEGSAPRPVLSEVSYAPGHPDWFPVSRGDMKSLVLGDLRYIRNGDGTEELYDVMDDPWEERDLAGRPGYGDELRRLRSRLDSTLAVATDGEAP